MNTFIGLCLIFLFTTSVTCEEQNKTELQCLKQKCHECSISANSAEKVICNMRNIMSLDWLVPDAKETNVYSSNSTNRSNSGDIEYACIHFVASNPKIDGDSSIILRGCHIKNESINFCEKLKQEAKNNDKTTISCQSCIEDDCNKNSSINIITSFTLILSCLFALCYNK